MPIKKGEKLWLKRKHHRGGRPKREEAEAKESARAAALRMIEEAAAKVVKKYLKFACANAATARHYMDKLLPDEYEIDTPREAVFKITVKRRVQGESGRDQLRPDRKRRSVRLSGG